jgi:hypothetical protein
MIQCRVWLGAIAWMLLCDSALAADERKSTSDSAKYDNVVVTGTRDRAVTEASEQTEQLRSVPGSFGDPLKSTYSLPGVVQSRDFGGQPAVRGSGPDDNNFMIDFLPAGELFHDIGFSVFNEHLLRDFGLKTAGFGPRYGKATGAVFDVTLREPRQQPWSYTFDSSGLFVGALAEGAITEDQSAYFAFRESVVHLLLKLQEDELKKKEDISFDQYPRARDLQAKYSWRVNDANRFSVLALGSQDQTEVLLGTQSDIALLDPNLTGKILLNKGFGSVGANWIYDDDITRWQSAAGYLSDYSHFRSENGEFSDIDTSRVTVKSHVQRQVSERHTPAVGAEWQQAKLGYSLRFRYRSCTNFTPGCEFERGAMITASDTITVNSIDAFIEDKWRVINNLSITAGAHLTRNDYLNETYVEPRVGADLQLSRNWGTHASWGVYHQLPKVGEMVPALGNPNLQSPSATHSVLGVTYNGDGQYSWTSDVYYKKLHHLVVDVASGQQYLNAANGEAYGAELMFRKNRDRNVFARPLTRGEPKPSIAFMDRLDGWVAVSLARSKRHNQLNNVSSLFEYDTPVIVNWVMNYRINYAWTAGMRWNFRSGLPYTEIVGNKPNPNAAGFFLPVFGELNEARARPYHRLDIRIERKLKFGSRINGAVFIDIINVYDRQNGGTVRYKPKPNSSEFELEEDASLPIVPSVGLRITF